MATRTTDGDRGGGEVRVVWKTRQSANGRRQSIASVLSRSHRVVVYDTRSRRLCTCVCENHPVDLYLRVRRVRSIRFTPARSRTTYRRRSHVMSFGSITVFFTLMTTSTSHDDTAIVTIINYRRRRSRDPVAVREPKGYDVTTVLRNDVTRSTAATCVARHANADRYDVIRRRRRVALVSTRTPSHNPSGPPSSGCWRRRQTTAIRLYVRDAHGSVSVRRPRPRRTDASNLCRGDPSVFAFIRTRFGPYGHSHGARDRPSAPDAYVFCGLLCPNYTARRCAEDHARPYRIITSRRLSSAAAAGVRNFYDRSHARARKREIVAATDRARIEMAFLIFLLLC